MPKTSIRNDTEGMLCLWLEPWGTDHWMRPGERFTVVGIGDSDPTDEPFEMIIHDQGISVWVNAANDAEVFDADGNEAPCAHQRPIETIRRWTENARQAVERSADQSPAVQELARSHYDQLQRTLAAAEAVEPRTNDGDGVINVSNRANDINQISNPG